MSEDIYCASINMTALVRRLFFVRVNGISKMAACNRKWNFCLRAVHFVTSNASQTTILKHYLYKLGTQLNAQNEISS